ncbi:MAG: hypothetical protein HYY20_08110 [Candidatus Tectomicrobia bacterium]|uniref:Glycine zipper domain-containing protein n=1 Tax=Tectimicrobiota bacterium TaxID=2528274 RepID=A0A932CP99_UNCTE|nr:hypothetical protein [Candidatus Tectomicrobia bacterium]
MRRILRQTLATGLCLMLIAISSLGCAELERKIRENPKTAIGAATGVAGGALLGGLIYKNTTGAVVGGLLGGLLGGVIGEAMESEREGYEETARSLNYTPAQGTLVRIEKVEALPSVVRPGETVQLVTHYALLTPNPSQEVSVTERREITKGKQLVGNPVLTVPRRGGTWASTIPLTLPATTQPGEYQVDMSVQADGSLARKAMTFTVQ